jgi:hypothetical protein
MAHQYPFVTVFILLLTIKLTQLESLVLIFTEGQLYCLAIKGQELLLEMDFIEEDSQLFEFANNLVIQKWLKHLADLVKGKTYFYNALWQVVQQFYNLLFRHRPIVILICKSFQSGQPGKVLS